MVFKLEKLTLTILPAVLNSFMGWMYPPEVIEEHGDAGDWQNLVGTGPMMLTDRVEGSSVTWVKNPITGAMTRSTRRTGCPTLTSCEL